MRKMLAAASIVLIGFAAGPVTPARAKSCGDLLAGHVYACAGTTALGIPEAFDLNFTSFPAAQYSGVPGECACKAKGRATDPNFEGSTEFLCIFPGLDLALEGKAAGTRITKGFWINLATQEAFECIRVP